MNTNKLNYTQKTIKDLHELIDLKHNLNKLILGNFNLLYLNINSLLNKLDDLELEIYNLTKNNKNKIIHAIALTEIRIHEHITQFFNIPHYTPFFCTRPDDHVGCALFVHESLTCNLIEKKIYL